MIASATNTATCPKTWVYGVRCCLPAGHRGPCEDAHEQLPTPAVGNPAVTTLFCRKCKTPNGSYNDGTAGGSASSSSWSCACVRAKQTPDPTQE